MYRKFGKRLFDVLFSASLLIVLSPVILIIALIVYVKMGRPILFSQERPGLNEKIFTLYKFRTMTNAYGPDGKLLPDSSRLSRFGKILRSTSLDELPELWNILKGDMSFVGTRPEVQKYVDSYTPEMMATLLLPAGITSRTSIAYKDEEEEIDRYKKETGKETEEIYMQYILPEKMKYNLEYIRSFSVLGDLKIMIDTALAVIR